MDFPDLSPLLREVRENRMILRQIMDRLDRLENPKMLVAQGTQPVPVEVKDIKKRIKITYARTFKKTSTPEVIAQRKRRLSEWIQELREKYGIETKFDPQRQRVAFGPPSKVPLEL